MAIMGDITGWQYRVLVECTSGYWVVVTLQAGPRGQAGPERPVCDLSVEWSAGHSPILRVNHTGRTLAGHH